MNRTIVLLVSAFFAVMTGCKNEVEHVAPIKSLENIPQLSSKNTEIIYSDSAIVKMKLTTPELNQYPKKNPPYTEFPKSINIEFYNAKKEVSSTLKANYAKYREKDEVWEFRGNVVVVNSKKDVLKTECLTYHKDKARCLKSDTVVMITLASGAKLGGTGFDSNQDFTEYQFRNPLGSK